MKLELILVAVAIAGCTKNSNYCPGANPDNNCAEIDAPGPAIDAPPTGCGSDGDCSGATAVCDTGTRACVACTAGEPGACTGAAPVCKQDACAPCSSHNDCSSNACLPDGSCGTDSNVAYVDPGGTDNTSCTKATPCTKVAKALATAKLFLKFHGTTNEQVSINNQNVTVLADVGAQLTSSSNGILVEIKGTSQVSINDLEITGASGGTGYGISMPTGNTATVNLTRTKLTNNNAGGISENGGTLAIAQSTVSGNAAGGILASVGSVLSVTRSTISGNTAGGISVGGQFSIVNNFFFGNGSGSSVVGAVYIFATQNAANRLDFNSFNKNSTQDGLGSAIQCTAGTFTARNNIMSGNGPLTDMNQTGGTCTHAYSIATPGTLPTGTGNFALDPQFVNTTTGDLHIPAGSPAIDAADPAAVLTGLEAVDIDGDARPQGVHADIGADEHKP